VKRAAARLGVCLLSGALASLVIANPVQAQALPNAAAESVAGRAHSEFAPIGMELGNFILHGKLTGELEYNDNIFLDNSQSADMIRRLKPSLGLTGDIGETSVAVTASADIARYRTFHTEGHNDYDFTASAAHDITDESNIGLALRRALLTEPRGSINDPGRAFGPTQYNLTTVTLSPQYSQAPYLGTFKLQGGYWDYLPNGPINNADRSYHQIYAETRAGYEFDTGWTAFFQPSYTLQWYVKRVDTSGVNHDNWMVQPLVGVTYNATSDLFFDVGVGYFWNPYFSATQKNLNGFAFNGKGLWNFAPDMTLTGSLNRSVQGVLPFNGIITATQLIETIGLLRLDYEAADQLLTYVGTSFINDDYPGATIENTLSFQIGVTYLVNEYLSLGLQYSYAKRDSGIVTRNYTNNIVLLQLTGQM
jgi:hypothetical protein